MKSTTLYRAYDQKGSLLYVGISYEPIRRFRTHVASSDWGSSCARLDMEQFATRAEAEEAERRAIQSERPQHNSLRYKAHISPPVCSTKPLQFLTPKAVCAKIALSRATLDRMVAAGKFPRPIRLTERRLAYSQADVETWMSEISAGERKAA